MGARLQQPHFGEPVSEGGRKDLHGFRKLPGPVEGPVVPNRFRRECHPLTDGSHVAGGGHLRDLGDRRRRCLDPVLKSVARRRAVRGRNLDAAGVPPGVSEGDHRRGVRGVLRGGATPKVPVVINHGNGGHRGEGHRSARQGGGRAVLNGSHSGRFGRRHHGIAKPVGSGQTKPVLNGHFAFPCAELPEPDQGAALLLDGGLVP